MTAEEFERGYAERSGLTLERLREFLAVRPCDCDADNCEGWQMMSHERAKEWDEAHDHLKHLV